MITSTRWEKNITAKRSVKVFISSLCQRDEIKKEKHFNISVPHQRLYHGTMQYNDGPHEVFGENQPYYLPRIEEEVEISDNMAVISVPPPHFRPGDPAYILHDFKRVRKTESHPLRLWRCVAVIQTQRNDPVCVVCVCVQKLTAYLDLTLRTCFVIHLNTSVVLPPQDLIDLFLQLMVSRSCHFHFFIFFYWPKFNMV